MATEVQYAGGSGGLRKYARCPVDFLGREQPAMGVSGMRSIERSYLRIDGGALCESLGEPSEAEIAWRRLFALVVPSTSHHASR